MALQTGELLNIHSLANEVGVSRKEAENYLDILENTFICQKVFPYFKNYGKEIIKTPKIYFLDLGLRNFILNQFDPLEKRTDLGKLFENFYFTELISNDFYNFSKINFWRTTNQTEVDFIVQTGNSIIANEVKWNKSQNTRSLHSIKNIYPEMTTKMVNRFDFTGEQEITP